MAELKDSNAVVTSRGMFRTGWVLTGFVGLFLLVDGGARLAGFAPYVEGMTKFGYAASLAPWIGLVLLLSTIMMLIPQTAALGSILVTGYLGGATATQVRGTGRMVSVSSDAGRHVVARTVPTRCARAGTRSVPHLTRRATEGSL